jgi:glycosyltransferase involved in cell wall biosynthesis
MGLTQKNLSGEVKQQSHRLKNLHLILSPGIDLDEFRRQSEQGLCPRHSMAVLADRYDAIVHIPHPERDRPNAFDRMRSRLFGSRESWAMARRLADRLGPGDIVFCQSESVGLPLASLLGKRSKRPKLFVFGHNLTSRRCRMAARLFGFASRVDAMGVCCSSQAEFLHRDLKIAESRIHLLLEHVDNRFFSPGPASRDKVRPVIAGVGLEKRDYRTLAQACRDLDVDIRISGFSRYAALLAESLPDPLPPNMTRRYYSWTELVQLYRDADVVVAPVFPCRYAAGVTTLIEALCCHRPVVVTRSSGLSDYLDPSDGLSLVEPFDSDGMRRAIVRLLEHPEEAREQADRGFQLASQRYDFDRDIDRRAELLQALQD